MIAGLLKKILDKLDTIGGNGGGVVTQPDETLLKTTVFQPNAADFNALVTPIQINSSLNQSRVFQPTYANLKGQNKITDGTNFMPTMDTIARAGYVKQAEKDRTISNTVDVNVVSGGDEPLLTRFYMCDETADAEPIWIPEEGKRISLTQLIVSTNGTLALLLIDCIDGEVLFIYLSGHDPVVINYIHPFTLTLPDNPLFVTVLEGDASSDFTFCMKGYELDPL